MSRFSIEATFKVNDKMSGAIGKIEGRTKGFAAGLSKDFDGLINNFSKSGKQLEYLAVKAGVAGLAVGAAAGVVLAHITHAGAEFEQSITNVGAVMGKNRGQIKELEAAAMSLGVTTQFSSSEVAEAMEFMARKGFDSGEILQGIPGVLNAVAASGEGMAEVATVVGSAIRGFGLEAKEAGYVANLLAFTAEKTGAKITDMGTAMSIAAPTAKALGVSIDDTAAAVGLLQKTGIDASTAGSAVATMLAKISHPSSEAASKMAAMGIKFKDTEGNMLSFRDVLGQFVKAGDKAGGNMDKMSFFAELVGLRGDKAALGLERMAKSGEFDKLLESLKNTGNYAEKVAQIRMDTTLGSWKLLTSTVEVLETKLFSLKSGALRGVVDSMNQWLGANQDRVVQKISDAISIATPIVKELASAFVSGFTAIMPAVKAFGAFMFNDFGSKAEWVSTLTRGVQIIGGLTVAAIGAAVVFGGLLAVAFADVVAACGWVISAWNGLIGGIGSVVFAVTDMAQDISACWRGLVASAGELARNVIDGLINGFNTGAQFVIDAAKNLGQAALDGIKSALHIHSPSRAFAEVGVMSAYGVAQGLDDGASAAVSASQALAGKVMGALAITAPAPDMSALSGIGAKVPPYAVGYDESPPRSSWLGQDAGDDGAAGRGVDAGSQVAPPSDMGLRETIDRHYSETKSSGELVITDQTGRAQMKKSMAGVRVVPSGGP